MAGNPLETASVAGVCHRDEQCHVGHHFARTRLGITLARLVVALVGRLRQETGCLEVIAATAAKHSYRFGLERALFSGC